MTKAWFRDLEQQANAKILVVDDLEVNRAVLTRRLAKQGYQIKEADSGRKALAQIEEDVPDLILLDMMMPDMSGLEVVEILRADHSPAALPIIMVTARTETEVIVETLEAGANDYIQKPVNFPVLLARMVTQIGRKRAEGQLLTANEALDARVAERALELHELKAQLREQQAREHDNTVALDQLAHNVAALSLAHEALQAHLDGAVAPIAAEIMAQADAAGDPMQALQRIKALAQTLEEAVRAMPGLDAAQAPPPGAARRAVNL